MIKILINELATDKINLSQALTRSKVIASTLNNQIFKKWLIKELEGYDSEQDSMLPEYRRLMCFSYLTIDCGFGQIKNLPIIIESNDVLYPIFSFFNEVEAIYSIEATIATINTPKCVIPYPSDLVLTLANLFQNQLGNAAARGAYKEISKTQLYGIINLTKQKLLNMLLELNEQFPNIDNEFALTNESSSIIQNIITTNIYGAGNPINIAAGENTQQNSNIKM